MKRGVQPGVVVSWLPRTAQVMPRQSARTTVAAAMYHLRGMATSALRLGDAVGNALTGSYAGVGAKPDDSTHGKRQHDER